MPAHATWDGATPPFVSNCLGWQEGLPGIGLLPKEGAPSNPWPPSSTCEFLLGRGCPVDVRSAEGATPLMNAVQSRNAWQVALLLDRGADPNAADERGFTALHRAAEMGQLNLVRLLLRRGAKAHPKAEGQTPLSLAEGRREMLIVELLKAWKA